MAHILPSRDAAEEILQEVFVRLWSESPSLSQEGGSVVAWLVVTAREAAVDRLRALRKNAPSAGPQVHSASPEKDRTPARESPRPPSCRHPTAKSLDGKTEALKPRPAMGRQLRRRARSLGLAAPAEGNHFD